MSLLMYLLCCLTLVCRPEPERAGGADGTDPPTDCTVSRVPTVPGHRHGRPLAATHHQTRQ